MKNSFEIIAKNGKKINGMLPMKEGKKQEAKKSQEQQNEELCNFIKTAFGVDGEVSLVQSKKVLKTDIFFVLKDSKRGEFYVAVKVPNNN